MNMAKKAQKLLPLSRARALEEIPLTRNGRPVVRGRAVYMLSRVLDHRGNVVSENTQKIARRASAS